MSQPTTDNQTSLPPFHLLDVLRNLWRQRKPIMYVTAAGALMSIVIAILLPDYYKGHTAFLALSPDQATIEGLFGNGNNQIEFYGNGNDIDRIMAVAESDELIDYMVDEFDLYQVYEIDSTYTKSAHKVRQEFMGNYEVSKTDRDAIELEILDQDPERAASMARLARNKIDEITMTLIRSSQHRIAQGLHEQVKKRKENLQEINQQLTELRKKYHIYNTKAQSEILATSSANIRQKISSSQARIENYRNSRSRGSQDSIAKLTSQLAGLQSAKIDLDSQLIKLNAGIGPIDNLEEERVQLNRSLSTDQIRLKQFETLLKTDQNSLEVIEPSKVPVIKSKPHRSLIVVVSTILTFIFACLAVILLASARRYDWTRITQ